MRKLSEGAEAQVFETNVFGTKAVVKLRRAKTYRIKELDETLRRTRTKKEARAMRRASEAGVRVPALLGLGKFSIYMEKVQGRLMKDAVSKRIPYKEIGTSLAKMHAADVVHGDFTPANIMISGKGICVIDFGLSDITNSTEDKALDLLLMKRSIVHEKYDELTRAYAEAYAGSKQAFSRLADIERRGRYQTRTLSG